MVQEKFSTAPPQGQSPLIRFKGTLDSYERREAQRDNPDGTSRKSVYCDLKYRDLEVLEATEPYPFPTASISINYQPPSTSFGNTRWDAFAKSLRNLLPEVAPEDRLDRLVGQEQELHFGPATIRMPKVDEDGQPIMGANGRQIWENGEGQAWQVVSINGATGASDDMFEYLAGLADGKTESQFYQAALQDQRVTSRTEIVTAITNREMLSTMLMAKQLTRDSEGLLHKA